MEAALVRHGSAVRSARQSLYVANPTVRAPSRDHLELLRAFESKFLSRSEAFAAMRQSRRALHETCPGQAASDSASYDPASYVCADSTLESHATCNTASMDRRTLSNLRSQLYLPEKYTVLYTTRIIQYRNCTYAYLAAGSKYTQNTPGKSHLDGQCEHINVEFERCNHYRLYCRCLRTD